MTRTAPLLFLLFLITATAAEAEWKKIDEQDGIQAFSEEVPGSKTVAFRGVATLDAPASKILWVLLDNDHSTEWVDRLKTVKVLKAVSPTDFVVYQEYKLSWPAANRDYVMEKKAVRDPKTKQISVVMKSVEHADAPKTTGVRAELKRSAYILTPLDNGKTQVEAEIHSDAKGSLPSMVVNSVQKGWPVKTLKGLAEQVKKPYVQEFDLQKL